MSAQKEEKVINSILTIKRSINDIIRDRAYIKDFQKQIIEHLYEIDDYSKSITVNILQKTDLHKCLKPLLQYPDSYFDMKEAVYNLLDTILLNMKSELFRGDVKRSFNLDMYNTIILDIDKEGFIKELQEHIIERSKISDKEDCFIRTDAKFLEQVKKNEVNTMIEAKRRQRLRRLENEKCLLVEINSNEQEENVYVKKNKNGIIIYIKKNCLKDIDFNTDTKLLRKKRKRNSSNKSRTKSYRRKRNQRKKKEIKQDCHIELEDSNHKIEEEIITTPIKEKVEDIFTYDSPVIQISP